MADKDFFLSPDDSQTMGDINYMRKSVSVRRTFPKTLKNKDGFAVEKSVSATEMNNGSSFNGNGSANSQNGFQAMSENNQAAQAKETNSTEQRRQVDTNLDMFRNMARNIKKR